MVGRLYGENRSTEGFGERRSECAGSAPEIEDRLWASVSGVVLEPLKPKLARLGRHRLPFVVDRREPLVVREAG